jgi:ketosteroid isomerase-like protein
MIGSLIAKSKVRKGFNSIARGDLESFVSVFSDDGEVVYPTKGVIRGKDGIRDFYGHFMRTFPKVDVEVPNVGVENLFDFVGTNVISTHFMVYTTNRSGVTYKQEGMQLIKIRRGKLTLLHYFFFDTEALRQAWKESE